MTLRIGQGIDVHRFADDPARPLVLGGVRFEGERGLVGHSDADAVAHACADALLGAAALGDLGTHFPDSDPEWADADSLELLAAVRVLLGEGGWAVVNVDITAMVEAPKLAPHRERMEANLTTAIGGPVSVKATRAEGLGPIGRGEGVVALAVALIERS